MRVTLRKRKNVDGTISLKLDIYHNDKQSIETLKELKLSKGTSLIDWENNKKKLGQPVSRIRVIAGTCRFCHCCWWI